MARTITQIAIASTNALVAAAAAIGITINPNIWIYVPGSLSQTDYKLLLKNMVDTGTAIQEQLYDAFIEDIESLIANNPPQTAPWIQNQFLNVFQWNSSSVQIPIIQPPSFVPSYPIINDTYKVIKYCSAVFKSNGSVLIRVAADSGGVPADLDTIVGAGALDSAKSFAYICQAPGITYTVTSGKSDWLFLQIDLYFRGAYASTIFNSVKSAITTFLNNLSTLAFQNNSAATFKLSALEEAILSVEGVDDVVFVNVAARPDLNPLDATLTTFGTSFQQFLVDDNTELQRKYDTFAGYIGLENGGSTGTPSPVPNSKLEDYRVGSSGILNLNCIAI